MTCGNQILLLAAVLLCALLAADSAVMERTFHVGNLTVSRLCERRVITAVNGKMPGPTIRVREGDTLLVHVVNHSPYGITIHWHGVFQKQSGWADGPSMITQCPIRPGGSYSYRFNVSGQEGTLWWHAHNSFLRATVHGAFIIRPRNHSFPFRKPHRQIPILLGEWWNADVVDLEKQAFLTGGGIVKISNAFTINGKPGHLYTRCKNRMIFTSSELFGLDWGMVLFLYRDSPRKTAGELDVVLTRTWSETV